MKPGISILGYLAIALSTTGILFKLQHWPGAGILLILGIALLNFGFLPLLFLSKLRKTTA